MKISVATISLFLILGASSTKMMAQNGMANNNTNVVQPKIMVIPFVKDGEDIRTILESDFIKREAIAKVKNGFDTRGFTTVDFIAKLTQAKDDKIFTTNVQSDVKSILVQFSGADIYVEVDINFLNKGRGSSAMVLLSAYDSATANAYASVNCDSQEHYNTDNPTLINAALTNSAPGASNNDESRKITSQQQSSCLDDFLNILQAKFTDIVEKGRPVKVNFSLSNDASKSFESKVKVNGTDKLLSDVIDDWLADNAYKGNYHMQGQTRTGIFYDEVRLPMFDKNGNNFRFSKFGQKLTEYLQSIGVNCSRSIKNGGIYVTVTN